MTRKETISLACTLSFRSVFTITIGALALVTVLSSKLAADGIVPAGVDAFATLPPSLGGNTSITIPGLNGNHPIFLEGANETQFCNGAVCVGNTPYDPLTGSQISALATEAPSLAAGLSSYQVQFVTPHVAVVGPSSQQAVGTSVTPILNANANFDTVVQRVNAATFTATGQTVETPIDVEMLNLQSASLLIIGGFHYELVMTLENGPVDPQFTGNLKLTTTAIDSSGGVYGTLDMGVTGPTPTASNLGADLPSGMEGLPVNFDIQFLPLDGGPGIPQMTGESIFQNGTLGSFSPVPEPSSVMLFVIGAMGLACFYRQKRGYRTSSASSFMLRH